MQLNVCCVFFEMLHLPSDLIFFLFCHRMRWYHCEDLLRYIDLNAFFRFFCHMTDIKPYRRFRVDTSFGGEL